MDSDISIESRLSTTSSYSTNLYHPKPLSRRPRPSLDSDSEPSLLSQRASLINELLVIRQS